MSDLKTLTQIVYQVAATLAALGALYIYHSNSRLEKSRWASALYEKFYEKEQLKRVRDLLDCEADAEAVRKLVSEETPDFTDYLNFFEYVGFLEKSKQLSHEGVQDIFKYYLMCLKRHKVVMSYIADDSKGYEQLRQLLAAE